MKIKLTAKTRKGKNRISQFGNIWSVEREAEKVIFSNLRGGWMLIKPENGIQGTRWINRFHDKDFKIIFF